MKSSFLLFLLLAFNFAQAQPVPDAAPVTPPKSEVTTPNAIPVSEVSAPPQAPGQPSGFYYYCEPRRAYFPTVSDCPSGWIAVPVSGPPMVMPPTYAPWYAHPSPPEATTEQIHSRPNSVNVDLFGRALLYSVNYDRAVTEHVTLGIGVSTWSDSSYWSSYSANVFVLPVYANYYFTEKANRGYVSLGVDYVHVSRSGYDNDTFTNTGFAGTVGGGYEHRDTSGFLFRLSGFLIGGRSFEISPSVTLGYAF